ncbi:MAG: HAMP domain-containing sensor histidine kinase [Actinomycetota bacterium]
MRTARTLLVIGAIAAAGALGTVIVGALLGMKADELSHLGRALAVPALVTVGVALAGGRLLMRTSLRQRTIAVALIGAVVALANVAVLTMQMAVSDHDATLVTVLLVYAGAAGVAAAIAVTRSADAAMRHLGATAERLAAGDLDARVGQPGGGPELDVLARTLDDMASALQQAQVRERTIERTRRDLISAVSHDLRTPLSSLRAMVEAIDENVVQDIPTMQTYAAEMRRSTDQLVGMVDDLFELTQVDAGAIEAETERARLSDIAATAVAAVRPQAVAKRLQLDTAMGPGAAETPCSPRLARVLQNLLANAVRHTPADGAVHLTATREGDDLRLVVEDTGEGIAPADLERVFEPFFRADPSRSGPGAGLGLALAQRIVETLGGRIGAESTPGGGSRFAVDVPVRA